MRTESVSPGRFARWAIVFAALPLLSGCIAAAVVPFVTATAISARHKVKVRAATSAEKAPRKTASKKGQAVPAVQPPVNAVITDLKELPPPDAPTAAADDPWQRFVDYAARQADQPQVQSALLAKGASIDMPTRGDCPSPHPAVIIDLDGDGAFAPDKPLTVPAGWAAGLERLRTAGVTILWISQLPASDAARVAQALKTAGLDPKGDDQLLLVRKPGDRKQLLRADAQQDVCVVAIAGDRRGDFDELFDYLRNPAGAVGLYPMMGSGWFLVPFPAAVAEAPAG